MTGSSNGRYGGPAPESSDRVPVPTPSRDRTPEFRLTSEFAAVRLEVDHTGNGERLCLTDLRSGKSVFLDSVQLEALVWVPHGEIVRLTDPGHAAWGREPS